MVLEPECTALDWGPVRYQVEPLSPHLFFPFPLATVPLSLEQSLVGQPGPRLKICLIKKKAEHLFCAQHALWVR